MFATDFDWIVHSDYKELEEKITKDKLTNSGLALKPIDKEFVEKTLKIINSNPFGDNTIELLLEEGWRVDTNYFINSCNPDKKKANIDGKISKEGEIYDYYRRDLILMHELNHAWFSRFELYNQGCLNDSASSHHEFDNRLVNELYSRTIRNKPEVLKAAVEGFGLKPQIYDASSKEAFKDNPKAKLSLLARKNPELLERKFIDGFDKHYYKIKLLKKLKQNPNEFWEKFTKRLSDVDFNRTKNFLLEENLVSISPFGNYAVVEKKEDEFKLNPCIDIWDGYYIVGKKDALNYEVYLKQKGEKGFSLVKVSKI